MTSQTNELALFGAIDSGDVGEATWLIRSGASVNIVRGGGETPLHRAVLLGRANLARLLINAGADVNACNEARQTPLHLAATRGDLDLVKLLLEQEVDAESDDFTGLTAAQGALAAGHGEVASLIEGYCN